MEKEIEKTEEMDFNSIMKSYNEESSALAKKYKVAQRLVVRFPHRPYGRAGFICRLLLKFLSYRGGMLDIEYSIKRK